MPSKRCPSIRFESAGDIQMPGVIGLLVATNKTGVALPRLTIRSSLLFHGPIFPALRESVLYQIASGCGRGAGMARSLVDRHSLTHR